LRIGEHAHRAKQCALDTYVSQHSALSPAFGDEAILPAAVLSHFSREYETFVVVAPAADPAYFDALYEEAEDPWGLGDRFYEQRKREILLSALPRRSFARAFEPGCATGELTVRLAERCAEVVAWDAASVAVQRLRRRAPRHVRVDTGTIPAQWPEGTFDLIVLSEVGYYALEPAALARRVRGSLTGDGVVVACHWRHPAADHPVSGELVHRALSEGLRTGAHHAVHHEERDFLLDVWSVDPRSVAEVEGIVP
jgi:SAM-dependent methyltransferase